MKLIHANRPQVPESDLELHREKTNFHLRIAEIVRENSVQGSILRKFISAESF
jgi:hypothetical protein